MKFFIVDDHIQIVRIVENIIEDAALGEVLGFATSGVEAVDEILLLKPDIVVVDFLMPGMDGARLVETIKSKLDSVKFIMLSQVSTKEMVQKSYEAGIEFFIAKPINQMEVTRVIKNVMEQIELSRKFDMMKSFFNDNASQNIETPYKKIQDNQIAKLKIIFSKIGIMGEAGGDDILKLCEYVIENPELQRGLRINDICQSLSKQPKAMEQRIRRAINRGLVNLANLGIEDYMNDTFMRFSSTLYDFESVKAEMDFIRGNRSGGGKISVKKFIENLLLHTE
ncbi:MULTISPECIES: response regulator [unclassified Fusibacter]|uniref:response regulator n=1 Tax=unclassified Fusibacter TaxID=2624464 RepID=UPI001012DF52|nr:MULTISPECIES: response regulator [unclassified Fusibacter]MCK8059078.1 response regulator [Fusibacter sp. A2]NPE22487.1 response regulator [Fusibacter sp. A1]RXV60591.1 response regulator [Fusibacter sp. A1]